MGEDPEIRTWAWIRHLFVILSSALPEVCMFLQTKAMTHGVQNQLPQKAV